MFESLDILAPVIGPNPIYVGLGSVWFVDFEMAYRRYSLDKMISIESDSVTFERAKFNQPFSCIEVLRGDTAEVIPILYGRSDLEHHPWILWLDHDGPLDDDRRDELTDLVENLHEGSVLMATYNAVSKNYAHDTAGRMRFLSDLFGSHAVDKSLPDANFDGEAWSRTLSNAALNWMSSATIRSGRSERFVPFLELQYRDTALMMTVGGILVKDSRAQRHREVIEMVSSEGWIGRQNVLLATQPLTLREFYALRQLLPREKLSREEIRELGFDLDDGQLELFQQHYLRYPIFVEMA